MTLDDEVNSLLAANQPAWSWIASAFGVLAAGAVGSYYLWKWRHPADFMPSSDYATYAGLFIMALAVERILEPFSRLVRSDNAGQEGEKPRHRGQGEARPDGSHRERSPRRGRGFGWPGQAGQW